MFSLFKKKPRNNTFPIIDLTLHSSLEDDYILPSILKQELIIRGIKVSCLPVVAEQRIAEWEEEFSINTIREAFKEKDWSLLLYLVDNRLNVYSEIEPHIHKIRSLYKLEKWQKCIDACDQLLQFDDSNIEAIRYIARCSKNLQLFEEAEKNYSLILKQIQDDIDSIISLVRINYNQKQFENVIKYSARLIEIEPSSRQGYLFLARGNLALQRYSEAIAPLQKMIGIDDSDIDALVDLGRTFYTMGQYNKSKEMLERVLRIDENEQRARRTLSLCYDRLRLWDDALKLYMIECEFEPYSFSNWEKLINLYYKLNRKDDAKNCLRLMEEIIDDGLQRYTLLHEVCVSFHWNEEASEYLQLLETRWNSDPQYYFDIINQSLDSGDLTAAQKYLQKGKRVCKGVPEYKLLKSSLKAKLNSVNLSWREIKRSRKSGDVVLHSEGAIRNILKIASSVKKNKVDPENISTVVISSTMGRGGAERQVVNCLKGLISTNKYSNVQLFCNIVDNSGGRIATYAPEINEMNISIDEYSKLEEWENKYGDTSANLGIFQDAFQELPIKMQNAIRPLYFAFCKIKPDIVHAWQDQTNINVAIAAKMAGVPGIVLFARSLRPDNKTMLHFRTRPYLRRAYQAVLEDKGILLCHNSNAGAESYSGWLDISSKRFPVIHNGIDFVGMQEEIDDSEVANTIREFGIPENAKIVGGVFRLVQEKRPKLWIESASKVIGEIENCHAVIIGGGGLQEEISSYIEELGMGDRIHLAGQTRQIKSWLDAFDVFLLTSLVEGLPNVLIEAQAFGVPVITTDAGGARDTIVESVSGFVVDADSSKIAENIITCLYDEKWLNNASDIAIENANQKFSTENMMQTLMRIYEKSIRNHIE
jgi:glycosyltransferase involved in cell wall biosynthesis/tetratricopeptide (TPR) repeat protein